VTHTTDAIDIEGVIEAVCLGRVEEIEQLSEVCDILTDATDEDKAMLFQAIRQECGERATQCPEGYAEPGYAQPSQPYVFLGNWWHSDGETLKESKLVSVIEAAGGAVEWHDEWTECEECNRAVRTKPDSHSWTRSYVEWDDEVACHECMERPARRRDFLQDQLEGTSDHAETLGWDLAELGYVRMDADFQNGLYGGQSASPHKIADALLERGIERFVFQIEHVRQFDVDFCCWLHSSEQMPALGAEETDGPDPAREMEAALKNVTTPRD